MQGVKNLFKNSIILDDMKTKVALLFLILFSLWLRFVQANLNYTELFGDELVLSNASLSMMQEKFSNTFFGYGDMCKVPYFIMDCIYYLYGVWKGIFNSVDSLIPKESFIYINRFWNVFFGALAIWPGYLLGKKLFGRNAGFVMALLVFSNPLQFKYSLYTNPDSTGFFFVLFSMVFALDIGSSEKKVRSQGYYLAGLFLAMAVSAKVNYALLILFPVFLHFLRSGENILKKVIHLDFALFFMIFGAGYFLLSPTVLLNLPAYLNFWLFYFFTPVNPIEVDHTFVGNNIDRILSDLQKVVGSKLLLWLVFFGILGLFSDWKKRVTLIAGLFILCFFTALNYSKPYLENPHHLFPLLPLLLLFITSGIQMLAVVSSRIVPILKPFLSPLLITCFFIFFPLKQTIINWKIDYIYLGAHNKQGFLPYFLYGFTEAKPYPLNPLSEREKNNFLSNNEAKWNFYGASGIINETDLGKKKLFFFEGPESEAQKSFLKGPFTDLSFWVYFKTSSQVIEGDLTVSVLGCQDSLGYKRKRHENRYHVLLSSVKNWKMLDIQYPEAIKPKTWTKIILPIRKNFKQDGIFWQDLDNLLLKIQFTSYHKELICYIKDIEWK